MSHSQLPSSLWNSLHLLCLLYFFTLEEKRSLTNNHLSPLVALLLCTASLPVRFSHALACESAFPVCLRDWFPVAQRRVRAQRGGPAPPFLLLLYFPSPIFHSSEMVCSVVMKQWSPALQHHQHFERKQKFIRQMRPYLINPAWDNKWVTSSKPDTKWSSSVKIAVFYLDFTALLEDSLAVNVTIKCKSVMQRVCQVWQEWIFDDI